MDIVTFFVNLLISLSFISHFGYINNEGKIVIVAMLCVSTSLTLLEYIIKWCDIQVIINPFYANKLCLLFLGLCCPWHATSNVKCACDDGTHGNR